ncbi:MAG: autotransporter outer membrane beta-barrel domain-containing protein [Granulosicoccus sp.]
MKTYRILIIASLCILGSVFQIAYAQSVTINLDVFGLNTNQSAADEAVNNACTGIGNSGTSAAAVDLLNTCAILNALNDEDPDLSIGLDRLLPEEAFAISDTLTDASDLQVTNVNARINTLREQQSDTSNQQASSLLSGGAAAAPSIENVELFITGQISDGDIDGRRLQQDADLSASQVTFGADYRLSDNFIVGAGIGIFQQSTDFSNTAGDSEVEGTNLTFFSTYSRESVGYLDVVLDIGTNEFDFSRQISLDGADQVLAVSSTDSSSYSLSVGVGKNFRFSGWDVGPYARAALTRASVDGYSEQATSNQTGFGSTLSIGSQSISSTTLSVGATVARVVNTSKAVLVPQASLEFAIEADGDKDPLSAFFLADPNQQVFVVDGEERDTSSANLGIGATAIFAKGRSAFAYYETRLAHDFITQNWFKVGARIEF